MRNSIILICFLFSLNSLKAQKIAGLWYSDDSTRVYEIKPADANTFTAVIRSSSRKNDSAGYIVMKGLVYNSRKKRYEGTIYAADGGQPAFVKIRFDKNDNNKLILKLNRMLLFDVSINWVRATTSWSLQ
ncbi:hypothetical protein [Ferruginibacter sp.]